METINLIKISSFISFSVCFCRSWKDLKQPRIRHVLVTYSMYFSQFRYYQNLEKGVALHLNKLECPSSKDALLQVWLKLDGWFWRRRFLKNFVNVFSLFCNFIPVEKGEALHLNKLESPLPKDALCQVWWKWTQWLWRRWFLKDFNVFFAIS